MACCATEVFLLGNAVALGTKLSAEGGDGGTGGGERTRFEQREFMRAATSLLELAVGLCVVLRVYFLWSPVSLCFFVSDSVCLWLCIFVVVFLWHFLFCKFLETWCRVAVCVYCSAKRKGRECVGNEV